MNLKILKLLNIKKIFDIVISNLQKNITTFKENLKGNINRDRNNILGLYKDIDENKKREDWNYFKSKVKVLINDKNNKKKYDCKYFYSIDELYKNKIKFSEELLENYKNEKNIVVLTKIASI